MAQRVKAQGKKPAERKSGKRYDKRLATCVSHPIRVDILRILNERTASPNELAKALGESLGSVSYHVKELREQGCIELVRTEPRRGALEHFYRAIEPAFVSDEEADRLPKKNREEVSATVLQAIVHESVGALRAGSFDSRPDRHASWMPMKLDEEGWEEMTGMLAKALEDAEEIKVKSAERLARSGEDGQATIVAMMGFERSRSRWK